MIKKITSIALIKIPEGKKIAYTVSTIDDNGNTIENNTKKSFVVVDSKLENLLVELENYVLNRENTTA